MPQPPFTLVVESFEGNREIVPMREGTADAPVRELAIGETRHRLFVRAPSGKLYVVDAPAELVDDLYSQPVLDDDIRALFRWRDNRTDRYGDDLVSLLMSEFGTNPDIGHHGDDSRIPVEHRLALVKFQALPLETQERLVEMYVNG